jgi:hypothetical protein
MLNKYKSLSKTWVIFGGLNLKSILPLMGEGILKRGGILNVRPILFSLGL